MTPRRLVLAAALLVLAPFTAVASVPRQRAADVLATTSLERSLAREAGSLFAVDDVSLMPRSREAGFRVFAGDELGDAHVLVFELGYPETRVGGFGLPDEARVGADRSLRLEAPWACDESSPREATGSGEFRIFDPANAPRSASAFGWNRLFQGREYLGFIDAYDFRARTLWPELGRFGQEDPLGTTDSANLYQGLLGNWGINRDPFGTETLKDLVASVIIESERMANEEVKHRLHTGGNLVAGKRWYDPGPDGIHLAGRGEGLHLVLVDAKHKFFMPERNVRRVSSFENSSVRSLIRDLVSRGLISPGQQNALIRNIAKTRRIVVGTGASGGITRRLTEAGVDFISLTDGRAARFSSFYTPKRANIGRYFHRIAAGVGVGALLLSMSERVEAQDFRGLLEDAAQALPGVAEAQLAREIGIEIVETTDRTVREFNVAKSLEAHRRPTEEYLHENESEALERMFGQK